METKAKQSGTKAMINQNFTTVKLFMIGFLTLVLMAPKFMVDDLITERKNRLSNAEEETMKQWSGAQTLTGPYLSIPYKEKTLMKEGDKNVEVWHERTAFFFPDELEIITSLEGIPLKRGIFEMVVYNSTHKINGKFYDIRPGSLGISKELMDFSRARVHVGISDLRGLETIPTLILNGKNVGAEQFSDQVNEISGIKTNLNLEKGEPGFDFSIGVKLKGSRSVKFAPLGKSTIIKMTGDWKDPSFFGNFLPAFRNVTSTGFEANWSVNNFNRSFGQEFSHKLPKIDDDSFGVSLKMPVDHYQKSTRATKYAVIVIILGFLSMLLLELITKIRIHFFQYTLVGLALVLFYSVLIAISEHLGFNWAYVIASISNILLLGYYSFSFAKKRSHSIVFATILTAFYAFIFVLVLEQEYSLLIGSLGLFTALAATMFFSRKIDLFAGREQIEPEEKD